MKHAAAPAIVLMLALPPGPASFNARAQVSVDRTVITLASAVATVEPNHMASGYRWLRVYLYAFPFTAADAAAAAQGDFHTLDLGWHRMPGGAAAYSVSNAGFQLSVDTDGKVWQMDLAVPGHTCTIAESDRQAAALLQEYKLETARVRLKTKGTFTCDMTFAKVPNQQYSWDVDLDVPVVTVVK